MRPARRTVPLLIAGAAVSLALALALAGGAVLARAADTAAGTAGIATADTVAAAVPAPADSAAARLIAAALADTFAYPKLGELCDRVGARLAGTAGYRAAVVWAATLMKSEGFDSVWTEPATVPRWERGEARARVVAPVRFDLPVLAFGGSVGTPATGLAAEVLAVASYDELKARAAEARGKIVLYDPPWQGYGPNVRYRSGGAIEAARVGAVACLVRSVTDHSLATLHTGVMHYDTTATPIPSAAVTVEDAGRLHRLCDAGLPVRVELELGCRPLPDGPCANVIGQIRGRERPDEVVVIAGHLDSWDVGTGAHDDGTGCILALAAARLLKVEGLVPRRSVRVVLYTSEEWGGQGGDAYRDLHAAELPLHAAAIESDSGGFPPAGFSVRGDSLVVARVAELARPLAELGADEVKPGWAGVDVGPIVELGVPGIGHRVHGEPYFSYHHSPADTFDKVIPGDLAKNVAAMAVLLHAVADAPERLDAPAP